ncbi:SDR family oxidoreductase [Noviherbaspirillum sp. CPCC 100848]|uniref:SDR family oxidoreductase n=1 Tax=Noviherbaspirillum album TaxID=3080276 RepID=A0ABU6JCL9_9BURK|nr:SDR family oxidoreductase [Noviherbaspirillum sp. CPCC 100848]MEC4721273.1 SDR family oxidoreductase [Noviherbaspirillum sp. CPCC 100848]
MGWKWRNRENTVRNPGWHQAHRAGRSWHSLRFLEKLGRNSGSALKSRMKEMPEEALDFMAQSHPMGRLATREEVANMAIFLLSDKASFCTGGFYPVDGGYTARW